MSEERGAGVYRLYYRGMVELSAVGDDGELLMRIIVQHDLLTDAHSTAVRNVLASAAAARGLRLAGAVRAVAPRRGRMTPKSTTPRKGVADSRLKRDHMPPR